MHWPPARTIQAASPAIRATDKINPLPPSRRCVRARQFKQDFGGYCRAAWLLAKRRTRIRVTVVTGRNRSQPTVRAGGLVSRPSTSHPAASRTRRPDRNLMVALRGNALPALRASVPVRTPLFCGSSRPVNRARLCAIRATGPEMSGDCFISSGPVHGSDLRTRCVRKDGA
jgi:hypothetical protein